MNEDLLGFSSCLGLMIARSGEREIEREEAIIRQKSLFHREVRTVISKSSAVLAPLDDQPEAFLPSVLGSWAQ
jgi:hypothetical protein